MLALHHGKQSKASAQNISFAIFCSFQRVLLFFQWTTEYCRLYWLIYFLIKHRRLHFRQLWSTPSHTVMLQLWVRFLNLYFLFVQVKQKKLSVVCKSSMFFRVNVSWSSVYYFFSTAHNQAFYKWSVCGISDRQVDWHSQPCEYSGCEYLTSSKSRFTRYDLCRMRQAYDRPMTWLTIVAAF